MRPASIIPSPKVRNAKIKCPKNIPIRACTNNQITIQKPVGFSDFATTHNPKPRAHYLPLIHTLSPMQNASIPSVTKVPRRSALEMTERWAALSWRHCRASASLSNRA
jgi:hypothetical protein